jgi:hypothetical protein
MATRLEQLYEDDFYAWTRDQAQALRRLAQSRPNKEIDFGHLVEEVRDLGIRERNAARSQVARIIEHALKLEHSRATDPRDGWHDSIADARRELEFRLTPSLRRDLAANLAKLHASGRRHAARGLQRHGEPDAAAALPETCPYTLDQLLDEDWLPPNRHGRSP